MLVNEHPIKVDTFQNSTPQTRCSVVEQRFSVFRGHLRFCGDHSRVSRNLHAYIRNKVSSKKTDNKCIHTRLFLNCNHDSSRLLLG